MTICVLFRVCILVVLVMPILSELEIWFASFLSHGRGEEFVRFIFWPHLNEPAHQAQTLMPKLVQLQTRSLEAYVVNNSTGRLASDKIERNNVTRGNG